MIDRFLKACIRNSSSTNDFAKYCTNRFFHSTKFQCKNHNHNNSDPFKNGKERFTTVNYVAALGVVTVGMSYAAVPLYRIFCQSYSYGGATGGVADDTEKVKNMKKVPKKLITIKFNADIGSSMRWNFRPQQNEIQLYPGETALAFYTAKNPSDHAVTGISTYNVIPYDAGLYFNKIQCFCFEEQQLNPHEQVDMPVFFYIDPEFSEDPNMEYVDEITLSYTFFEAKEGLNIPLLGHNRKK